MNQHAVEPMSVTAGTVEQAVVDRPRVRLAALIGAHPVVDIYSNFIPPLLGLMQVRADLTDWQVASLVAVGPLVSGGCQPFVAWVADRTGWTVIAPIGLALAAGCISVVGLAGDYTTILLLYIIGMLGVAPFIPSQPTLSVGSAGLGGRQPSLSFSLRA